MTPGDRVRVTETVTVEGLIWDDGSPMPPFQFLTGEELVVVDVRAGAVKVSDSGPAVWIPSRLVEKCG
jgi:hypothetical protein